MKNVTISEFRNILDSMNLVHSKDSDKVVSVPLSADNDFDHNLAVRFLVNGKKIQVFACVPGYGSTNPRSDSLEFCNKWNREKVTPRAYLDDDNVFILDTAFFTDEELSEEYVKENVVKLSLATFWQFFVTLKKHLDGNDEET